MQPETNSTSLRQSWQQFRSLHIDPLERRWITVTLLAIGLMVGIMSVDALWHGVNPPSKVEVIDSASLHLGGEFAEDNMGVQVGNDGKMTVRVVAGRYGFFPKHLRLPAGKPVTFRWASLDVLHGVHIPMTNMSTMIVPGYVAEITTTFPNPGEYPLLCNEYCGLGHNHMWSTVSVVDPDDWQAAPATGAQP